MWVRAGLLTPGMTLLDDQGNPVTLLSTQTQLLPNGVQVYNLEVDADHTYFVLDNNGVPVWVHNGGCNPLRKNLSDLVRMPRLTEAAHHIVPQAAKRFASAVQARAILKWAGIGVHDITNGVWLRSAQHTGIHTRAYYDAVLTRLREARIDGPLAVKEALYKIGSELRAGTFTY